MRNAVRILLITYLVLVAGCAYNWQQAEDVQTAHIHKVETPIAPEFCTKLLGGLKRGCAVRMTNTSTGVTNCVMVVLPGDLPAVRHEAGGHCMGQDH